MKNLVEFVGVEKAISIYLKVESVEANGGMATMKVRAFFNRLK